VPAAKDHFGLSPVCRTHDTGRARPAHWPTSAAIRKPDPCGVSERFREQECDLARSVDCGDTSRRSTPLGQKRRPYSRLSSSAYSISFLPPFNAKLRRRGTSERIEPYSSSRFYEAVVVKLHEFVAKQSHTSGEAVAQALPNSRARASGRSTGDRISSAPRPSELALHIAGACGSHAASIRAGAVRPPSTRDIIREGWRRAPLLHFGSSR
jgi:hypothetical protein